MSRTRPNRRAPVMRPCLACALLLLTTALGGRAPGQVVQGVVVEPARPAAGAAAKPAPDTPPELKTPSLHLANGGYLGGALQAVEGTDRIRWRSPAFATPIEFARSAVGAVHWPPVKPPQPTEPFLVELVGGDALYADLVGLDADWAELKCERLGQFRVRRSGLQRLVRWRDGADLVYLGPNGLSGWDMATEPRLWREEAGHLVSDKPGASARADLGLPARALVEFELAWKTKPDFSLVLAEAAGDSNVRRAFRFEVWNGKLVAVHETEQTADLAPVADLPATPGRTHLLAYLDQEAGRMLIVTPDGRTLADLKTGAARPGALPRKGVRLVNHNGDVSLERLRVTEWSGETPVPPPAGSARVRRADGTFAAGQVERLDAATGELVVTGGSETVRIPLEKAAELVLIGPTTTPSRAARVSYQDGVRFSGTLGRVDAETIELTQPDCEAPLRLPIAGLRSLVLIPPDAKPEETAAELPRLELDGLRLSGKLVPTATGQPGGPLSWQANGAMAPVALGPDAAGRILFQFRTATPAKPDASSPAFRRAAPPPANAFQRLVRGLSGVDVPTSPTQPPASPPTQTLYLRTGDNIPCTVTGIDETGVTFKTALSDGTSVKHDQVQAIELAKLAPVGVRLSKTKRERLLTLPRMQKNSPPTQLIRSKTGDLIRGRIVGLDDQKLRLEVRLDERDVPRDRLAQIIWLHPEPPAAADGTRPAPAAEPAADGTLRIQALRRDGTRLTFRAQAVDGDTVVGRSDVLGACRVGLGEVDELLLGSGIDKAAAQLAYNQWKLKDAVEPKYVQGGDDASAGTESVLVGKPAPEFQLDVVDGKPFKLADTRGKVVILDFWATWCGPCLQAMPQVDRVAHEFEKDGVLLVAVNLQEGPELIKPLLDRLKLKPMVALDRDGIVAQKYGANAIPQTVVIDREGKVTRLFVGGGPKFEDQLREAVQATLNGNADAPAPADGKAAGTSQ